MSADKDGKAETSATGAKPTTKTVVGVPMLPAVPPDTPSDAAMTHELPARTATDEPEEPATALDVKAMSTAEAERVLAWTGFTQEEIPTASAPEKSAGKAPAVAGAVPKPTPRPVTLGKTNTPSGQTFAGLGRKAPNASRMALEKPTRPGIAPQPGISPSGRSTLLLDSSSPPAGEGDGSQERPAIVVPGAAATAPKAVTQAPPWSEGAVHMSPAIPKGAPAPREKQASIEEISSSLLLPDASGEAPAQNVEELSGSVLIEDAPDGSPVVRKPPGPSAPPRAPSVKPPVPKSSRPPAAHRALLGIPELPKATPAPKLDLFPMPPASSPPPHAFSPPHASSPPAPQQPPAPEPPAAFPPASFPPVPPPDAFPPPAGAAAEVPPVPPPPAPEPPTAPMTGDIELTRLPRQGLQPFIDNVRKAFERLRAKMPPDGVLGGENRPPWFLPAVAVAGLAVGVGLVGIIVSAVRGGGAETAHASGPSTSATARPETPGSAPLPSGPTGIAAPAPVPAPAPSPSPSALVACTVAGPPHVIGPSATVTAGVEVVHVGSDLALGFAPSDHEAIAVRVDPTSLAASATMKGHTRDTVRRVTPLENARGGLSLVIDTDRKGDRVQGRRTVLTDPPVQLGASEGHVVFARVGGAPAGQLWALDDGPPIDALRGAVANDGERTIAVAFRRGGAVWMGTAAGAPTLAPKGDLSHIEGLGTAVGSPAVAIAGGSILVAWSDRPSSDEPWRLRWTHFDAGGLATAADTFQPPAGGKGEHAMSPALTALPGGGFLFVWTEGPPSGHDVRALTLTPDGKPVGAPLVISNPGINAGQAQAAVNASGRGVVAFLESGGNGFQVVATPIACGE